jgi:hypothetical protein
MKLEDQDSKLRDTLSEIKNSADLNSNNHTKIESELSSLRAHFLKSQKIQWINLMKEVDNKMNSLDLAPVYNKFIEFESDIRSELDKFVTIKDVEKQHEDFNKNIKELESF